MTSLIQSSCVNITKIFLCNFFRYCWRKTRKIVMLGCSYCLGQNCYWNHMNDLWMPLDFYFCVLHITRTQITPVMKKMSICAQTCMILRQGCVTIDNTVLCLIRCMYFLKWFVVMSWDWCYAFHVSLPLCTCLPCGFWSLLCTLKVILMWASNLKTSSKFCLGFLF